MDLSHLLKVLDDRLLDHLSLEDVLRLSWSSGTLGRIINTTSAYGRLVTLNGDLLRFKPHPDKPKPVHHLSASQLCHLLPRTLRRVALEFSPSLGTTNLSHFMESVVDRRHALVIVKFIYKQEDESEHHHHHRGIFDVINADVNNTNNNKKSKNRRRSGGNHSPVDFEFGMRLTPNLAFDTLAAACDQFPRCKKLSLTNESPVNIFYGALLAHFPALNSLDIESSSSGHRSAILIGLECLPNPGGLRELSCKNVNLKHDIGSINVFRNLSQVNFISCDGFEDGWPAALLSSWALLSRIVLIPSNGTQCDLSRIAENCFNLKSMKLIDYRPEAPLLDVYFPTVDSLTLQGSFNIPAIVNVLTRFPCLKSLKIHLSQLYGTELEQVLLELDSTQMSAIDKDKAVPKETHVHLCANVYSSEDGPKLARLMKTFIHLFRHCDKIDLALGFYETDTWRDFDIIFDPDVELPRGLYSLSLNELAATQYLMYGLTGLNDRLARVSGFDHIELRQFSTKEWRILMDIIRTVVGQLNIQVTYKRGGQTRRSGLGWLHRKLAQEFSEQTQGIHYEPSKGKFTLKK